MKELETKFADLEVDYNAIMEERRVQVRLSKMSYIMRCMNGVLRFLIFSLHLLVSITMLLYLASICTAVL